MIVIPEKHDQQRGEVMMAIGCLHDIAEKTNDQTVKKQLATVQLRLEKILRLPEMDLDNNTVIPKYFNHDKKGI